ncbi:hypothetical protein GCM10023185_29880 [Hymenobacter saemangeumensis]|uniref:Uncharacterized protein n=1 Tax=Hymenobacter saemangeumensis TaxID=1084522 RepID=A0ABP8IL94_9BACT
MTPPKPARYHHAPAQLDPSRRRVVIDLPAEQLQQLLDFLKEELKAKPYG